MLFALPFPGYQSSEDQKLLNRSTPKDPAPQLRYIAALHLSDPPLPLMLRRRLLEFLFHHPPLLVLVNTSLPLRILRPCCRDGRVSARVALGLSASSLRHVPAVPARMLDEEGLQPRLGEVGAGLARTFNGQAGDDGCSGHNCGGV
jgi:hypothetical protein